MHEPAPIGRRLTARILDLLFALVLTFVSIIPIALVLLPFLSIIDNDRLATFGAAACYFLAYVVLEFFLLVRRDGQTLGKGLMGLRVVDSKRQDARPLQVLPALLRLIILFTPFVLLSVAGAATDSAPKDSLASASVLVLLTSLILAAVPGWRRRAVHDYLARSQVVRAPRRAIALREDVRMMVPGKIDMTKRL
ncbi:MAG: RDD family protein [Pseudonocardia sp.]